MVPEDAPSEVHRPEEGNETARAGLSSNGPTDADLVQATGQKNEQAFAELVRRYQTRVLNLCYRHLGYRGEADIVAQDAFMQVWEHAGSFRGGARVWTWIYRIVVNLCCDLKVHKERQIGDLDESVLAPSDRQPDVRHHLIEKEQIVQRALDSLSPDQRMVIVLTRYEGLSYEDTAEVMGKSVRAVATLLFRARETLRAKLSPFLKRGKLSP